MIRLAICIVLVGACAADPAPDPGSSLPLDPVGTYSATATWTSGNCQVTAPETDTFTIAQGATRLEVTSSDPDVTYDAIRIACTADSCELHILREWFVDADLYNLDSDLTLASDDAVTGNGTLKRYLSDYEDCRQTASVAGRRM